MSDTIKINCYDLFKNGIYLSTQISKLKEIVDEMRIVNNDIKDSWDGIDYDKFYQSFDEFLNKYEPIEANLLDNVAIMKNIAKKHGSIDTDLKDTARRWDVSQNEYKN